MATKKQLARNMYGEALDNLTAGQKAAVTRAYNAQDISEDTEIATFVRAGGNSVSTEVPTTASYQDALEQIEAFNFNSDKEGLQNMEGETVRLEDTVKSGNILVAPNVDSAY